jgi:hypothetical protein
VFPKPTGGVGLPVPPCEFPPPEPPLFPEISEPLPDLLPPPPPPAEVIVVNPEPEIDEFEPLFPLLPCPTEAPPSPTVTVITVPTVTDCVDSL